MKKVKIEVELNLEEGGVTYRDDSLGKQVTTEASLLTVEQLKAEIEWRLGGLAAEQIVITELIC